MNQQLIAYLIGGKQRKVHHEQLKMWAISKMYQRKSISKEVNIANCYHETDPDNTYLEQWVKIDDGELRESGQKWFFAKKYCKTLKLSRVKFLNFQFKRIIAKP